MKKEKIEKNINLQYKGFPLVRSKNQIYYGNVKDKYIIFIQILNTEKVNNINVGKKVFVQLLSTDTNLEPSKRIIKQTDRQNLLSALEIANVWILKGNAISSKTK